MPPLVLSSNSQRSGAAIGHVVFAFALFATLDASIKWLSFTYDVLQLTFTTSLVAFIPVAVLVVRNGGLAAMQPRNVKLVALRALLLAVDTVCAFTAFSLLPLADAYTLLFAGPMLVTALSVPILKEHVGWRRWSAVIVGFCGVLIILRPGFAELTLGHLAALGATLTFSLSTIILRRLGESESSGALLVSTLLALVLVTAPALPFVYVAPDLTGWALMIGGGLLAGIAHIGLVKGFRMAPPAIVAPFQYTQMIWAVFYGYVVFKELPEIWTIIGSLVIAASGLYILWRETILGRVQPVPPAPTQ